MKLCQSSKRGAFSAALIALGLGLTLIAGCSDSRTSVGDVTLQKNLSQRGASPPTLVYPEEFQSLIPGETVEIRWLPGAGPLANLHFSVVDPRSGFWQWVWVEGDIPNTGSRRVKIPASVPQGMYSIQVQNFYTHRDCMWASFIGYYEAPLPKVLVGHDGKVGWGPTVEQAMENCLNPTEPSWTWLKGVPCVGQFNGVVDVNNNYCKTGMGGEADSHYFFIGPVIEELVARASSIPSPNAYVQIENSQSNQAAAAAQSKNTDEQAAPTPANVVQISNENDAKDDKSVTHIASSGVAGGR